MPHGRFASFRADVLEFLVRRHVTLPPEIRSSDKLHNALTAIATRWPESSGRPPDTEKPIFIFSAGWRSGSTLLQRLVMSRAQAIVWGEPLGDTATIVRLAHSLEIIGHDWPPQHFFPGDGNASSLAGEWIANLTPDITHLREAHRSFFLTWLRDAAKNDYGIARWGLKEVRLTMDHARYLHWLFPEAKFLFICRNPLDAFKSWKGNRWRSPWPGYYRNSALAFARHWSQLVSGFLAGHGEVGGMLIRYEDLAAGRIDLDRLADYLEFDSLDPAPLARKIDTPTNKPPPQKRALSILDRLVMTHICGPLMKQLDYHY